MRLKRLIFLIGCAAALYLGSPTDVSAQGAIKLPNPALKGKMSVEEALVARKTSRNFKAAPLALQQVSQLLWAADGKLPADAMTGATRRVIPSAGGLYPLELVLVAGEGTVEGLPAGVYKYDSMSNSLQTLMTGDKRAGLAYAALSQGWLARAPALIVIGAVFGRTTAKYGDRGYNYVFMEAGHANQNVCLQAEAIGLHTGTVGAFNDSQVAAVLKLPAGTAPLLVVAVGK